MADADTPAESESHQIPRESNWTWVASVWGTLVGIALIAIAGTIGRLLALDRFPAGLADAEAAYGLKAREAVDFGLRSAAETAGDLSIPLVTGIALLGGITGFDEVTPRIVTALAGGVSLLFTGLWLRREIGHFWGVAGASVLAASFWHILFSRVAIGPIVGALALAVALWLLSIALDRQGTATLPWYLLFGVSIGVGFLAAPGLRLLPLVVAGILAVAVYREWREPVWAHSRSWLIATVAMLVTIGPFLLAHVADPQRWTPWASTPGLPNEDRATVLTLPGAIIETVTGLVLPASSARGLNLPGDSWFTLFMLPWAVIGLLGLIGASNNQAMQHRFLAGGAGVVALLIGISAIDAGHPGQYLLISPLLAGLVVYGFRTALNWARMPTVRVALSLLIILGIGAEAYAAWDEYRHDWSSAPETRAAFNAGLVEALHETVDLPPDEPVFVNVTGHESLLGYLQTSGRRHTFDGTQALPIPAEENGYLATPHASPISVPLEQLLAEASLLTDGRDENPYDLYRLDDRIRQQLPFGVPTYSYDGGPVLSGGLPSGIDDGVASVLVAWNLPAESQEYRVDVHVSGVDVVGPENQTTVTIPRNPLSSRLYQVVYAEVEIPREADQFDLSVRLRGADGQPLRTGGVDPEAFVLLNRYELPE